MVGGVSPWRVPGAGVLAALLGLVLGASTAAASAGPQVVGGSVTPITSAPFIVALYDPSEPDPYQGQFCGGVILDATHVITAAHCLLDDASGQAMPPSAVAVLAGTGDLYGAGVSDPAAQTSFDPDWDPSTGHGDIGIVTLAEPLWSGVAPARDGTSTIAPIPLVTSPSLALAQSSGTTATAFGWGYDEPLSPSGGPVAGGYPNLLQSVPLALITNAQCAVALEGIAGFSIAPAQLCASPAPASTASTCFGDSGGPLVIAPGGSTPADDVLVGLVDLVYGCGHGFPDVFTNVADPGNVAFLGSSPPQAPFQPGGATASIAGSWTLTCDSGGWIGGPTLGYQFYVDTGEGNSQPLTAVQSSPSYTPPPGGVGGSVFCLVTAANRGGFAYAESGEVTPFPSVAATTVTTSATPAAVTPTSSSTTSTTSTTTATTSAARPTLRLLGRGCARRRCTVVVAGSDAGGPGVLTVSSSLRAVERRACRVGGRRATCTRSVRRSSSVQSLSGVRFEVTAAGLAPGRYTLTLVAVDRAGRLQSPATTLELNVAR